MKKVLFLDRDGVINRERGEYTFRREDFEFLPDLFPFLTRIQQRGFTFVVITNQGGIAKGLYSLSDFRRLDQWMHARFEKEGIHVLKTYFSPDHDDYSKSLSRKPESILFERAIAQFDIDPKISFMIGDTKRDILAAEKVGVRGIQIPANSSLVKIEKQLLNQAYESNL